MEILILSRMLKAPIYVYQQPEELGRSGSYPAYMRAMPLTMQQVLVSKRCRSAAVKQLTVLHCIDDICGTDNPRKAIRAVAGLSRSFHLHSGPVWK